jgi:glucose-6-phosphate isomerase
MLEGAHAADLAALEPQVTRNAAMLDALIGIYLRNVLPLPCTAILPYSQALSRFPRTCSSWTWRAMASA